MKNDDFLNFLVVTDQLDDFLRLNDEKTDIEQNKEILNDGLDQDDKKLEITKINDNDE